MPSVEPRGPGRMMIVALAIGGCVPPATHLDLMIEPPSPAPPVIETHDTRPPPRSRYSSVEMMSMDGVDFEEIDCLLHDDSPTAFMTALADVASLHDRLFACAPMSSRVAWEVVGHRVSAVKVGDARVAPCVEAAFHELHAKSDGDCRAKLTVRERPVKGH